jgi:hypothetical protein
MESSMMLFIPIGTWELGNNLLGDPGQINRKVMKTFLEFLNESIIDPHHDRLAPEIFEVGTPSRLKALVRDQIRRGVAHIESHAGVKVSDYRLIGSILTHRYSDDSDLDINVLIDGSLNQAIKVVSQLSGKPIPGSPYVVNFHVLNQRAVWDAANRDADGVFDVEKNRFERVPKDLPFDVGIYWKEFTRVASTLDTLSNRLKKEVLDFKAIRTANHNDLQHLRGLALQKLRSLKKTVVSLIDIYKVIKQQRDSLFHKELTKKDIVRYGEKNRMPANVIYKLLEKYHYLKLLNSIADIIGHDGSLSAAEIKELRQLFTTQPPK